MIVQELHRIQHTHRYLPDAELRKLAERTGTPLYRLQEVASFFPHFKLSPPPAVEVHICHDMACHQRGCTKMKQDLQSLLASECSAGTVAVEYASCLGRCDRPVAAMINDTLFVSRSAESLAEIAQSTLAGRPHQPDADGTYALNANRPWRIDPYNGPAPYEAVRLLVASGDRAAVIEQIKA